MEPGAWRNDSKLYYDCAGRSDQESLAESSGEAMKVSDFGNIELELTPEEVLTMLSIMDDVIEEHQSTFNSDVFRLRDEIRRQSGL